MFATRERRAAWLLGFVAVATGGIASLALERRYSAAQAAVHEAQAIRQAISETLSLLKDAETGQRGLLLTDDEAFLVPHVTAKRALSPQLERLAGLVHSDPEQQDSVSEIRLLAADKLRELDKTLVLYEEGKASEAVDLVLEGRGRRLMDSLREETDRMLTRQDARVRTRELEAETGRRWLMRILFGSSALFLSVVAWGVWSSARGIAEAKQSRERLRQGEHALRMVADHAAELVCIVDGAALSYVSPSCERILGFLGDRALGVTARLLASVFRESDIVARLGGDEFAVFAPDCDADGTRSLRERLGRHLDELNDAGGEPFRLSFSVGTAPFDPIHPVEFDALLETADREMYERKRARSDSSTATTAATATPPAATRAAGG
jgi:CHASE3 domain sensor protein